MRSNHLRALLLGSSAILLLLTGCSNLTLPDTSSKTFPGSYKVAAYRPRNPDAVRVKVSLDNRMVYVMEGSRPLLVTPCTIGVPTKPTPRGSYHVTGKIRDKRSASYGFWVRGNQVIAGTSGRAPGAGFHYVGYPMAYWVEFKPEYGFHSGAVWPTPHSHGCIRLHPNAAPKFFALVHEGTPISIADRQPEDQTVGRNVSRPGDYRLPDPPAGYMTSSSFFSRPQGELLQ